MKIKEYIRKLQNLPEIHKKIILWTIVAILGIILATFWFMSAKQRLAKIGESVNSVNLPFLELSENGTSNEAELK